MINDNPSSKKGKSFKVPKTSETIRIAKLESEGPVV